MLDNVGVFLSCLLAARTATAAGGLALSARTLPKCPPGSLLEGDAGAAWPDILLVVPALREARIIAASLECFVALDYPTDRLSIVVAAAREQRESGRPTTAEVVRTWAAERGMARVHVTESPDARPERATQINYAVRWALRGPAARSEVIGIYDVDSRPCAKTLRWVAWNHSRGIHCQQQVLHYLDAANDLARRGASALCVANAIYQGSWSLTKEWPNLFRYRRQWSERGGPYRRSLYLNGHGQFLSRSLFEAIGGLPSGVITDGIQLGYRLSLLGEPIAPIPVFCSDDVPISLTEVREQHRRWFAGNIRFGDACVWARGRGVVVPRSAMLDNILLNGSWALRLPTVLLASALVLFAMKGALQAAMAGLLASTICVYGLLLPLLAAHVPGVPLRLRRRDWLAVPLAAGFKSIGPLLYLAQVLWLGRDAADRTLRKAER
jgi:cellulose synthase/poly-beta-1,6-N-acetylglucosamine synthase-like glycosyltransferase